MWVGDWGLPLCNSVAAADLGRQAKQTTSHEEGE